jgi:ketosteroid isomerase-like protein
MFTLFIKTLAANARRKKMPLNFEDKMEIQEVIARYANTFDSGNFDDWLDTWTDDGVWDGGPGVYTGKSELAKLIVDLGGDLQDKRRVMTNVVISGVGDQAIADCYMLVIERKVSSAILATAVYSDTLKKVDGSWKFARRIVTMDPSCGMKK